MANPKEHEVLSPERRASGDRRWPGRAVTTRAGDRFRAAIESVVLAGLLLTAAVSVVVGSSTVLLCAVAGAWLLLAVVVGPRNVFDAGCYFMLLVVGVILVVDLAAGGPKAPLP
jgi:hypothetical protein